MKVQLPLPEKYGDSVNPRDAKQFKNRTVKARVGSVLPVDGSVVDRTDKRTIDQDVILLEGVVTDVSWDTRRGWVLDVEFARDQLKHPLAVIDDGD